MECLKMDNIRKRLWDRAEKNNIPLMVAFELLPVCNLECKMCYVRKSMSEVNAAGGLIGGDRWLEIAKEAADCGLLFPLITGGEPFLHPDFRRIFTGMLDMGMQVSINSNGTMIDREMAQWLSEHRPIRINITLYGASADTYERLCGRRDAFERVQNAVKWLKEYDIPIKFNTSITPENIHELEAIIAYAKSVDSPIQVAEYMFPPIRRSEELVGQNERLTPDEAGRVRALSDLLILNPDQYRAMAYRQRQFIPVEEALDTLAPTPEGLEFICRAGRCSCWIDWQGNLVNCGMYASMIKTLKDRPFAEVWQEMVEETKRFRYRPICERCPNKRFCHPCVSMVYNECGTLEGRPEYVCRMNEAAARYYQLYAEQLGDADQPVELIDSIDAHSCDLDDM